MVPAPPRLPDGTPSIDDFSTLFDFLPIGAYRSLPGGQQLRANPALVRLNGYESEAQMLAAVQDIGREWYVDPTRRDTFRRRLERDGHVLAFESEIYRHRTRERIWISENAHVVRGPGGRVLFYEGTVEEITGRVRAAEALRESERRWKRALEAGGDGVWDWNVVTGEELLSAEVLALYGYAPGELPPRATTLDGLTHPEDRAAMKAARQAHFAGRTPRYVSEHRVRCKDGRWKWILSRGIVIERGADGRALRMIGTHTDIDARKRADGLAAEQERVAAAQRAQTNFLSRVSHELRTPLNGILGFAQLIEAHAGTQDPQRGWNAQVLASGRLLLGLVEDILDLSSVQGGQLPIEPEALDLVPLVREAWAMVAMGGHGVAAPEPASGTGGGAGTPSPGAVVTPTLVDSLPPAMPVLADRKRLAQVVVNLLSNACKYNRVDGCVVLRAAPVSGGRVSIAVEDTGIGIPGEQMRRLFTPFERLGAEKRGVPGTGLGLALTRQLVEAMGGTIAVESAAGVGSTFTVTLPAP
jgi:PAS domain S-box-containing protein